MSRTPEATFTQADAVARYIFLDKEKANCQKHRDALEKRVHKFSSIQQKAGKEIKAARHGAVSTTHKISQLDGEQVGLMCMMLPETKTALIARLKKTRTPKKKKLSSDQPQDLQVNDNFEEKSKKAE